MKKKLMDTGTTVLAVRESSGLVARGTTSVKTAKRGRWELIVDDFDVCSEGQGRLAEVLSEAPHEPIRSVLRHFRGGCEVFVLLGPPGVIAGAAPGVPDGHQLSVLVEKAEGVIAIGLETDRSVERPGWVSVPAGRAVCWGPAGPEVFCDLRRGTVWDSIADAREPYWLPEAPTAA
jgi:hypothetical protein